MLEFPFAFLNWECFAEQVDENSAGLLQIWNLSIMFGFVDVRWKKYRTMRHDEFRWINRNIPKVRVSGLCWFPRELEDYFLSYYGIYGQAPPEWGTFSVQLFYGVKILRAQWCIENLIVVSLNRIKEMKVTKVNISDLNVYMFSGTLTQSNLVRREMYSCMSQMSEKLWRIKD